MRRESAQKGYDAESKWGMFKPTLSVVAPEGWFPPGHPFQNGNPFGRSQNFIFYSEEIPFDGAVINSITNSLLNTTWFFNEGAWVDLGEDEEYDRIDIPDGSRLVLVSQMEQVAELAVRENGQYQPTDQGWNFMVEHQNNSEGVINEVMYLSRILPDNHQHPEYTTEDGMLTVYRGIRIPEGTDPVNATKLDPYGEPQGGLGDSWTVDERLATYIANRGSAGMLGGDEFSGKEESVSRFDFRRPSYPVIYRGSVDPNHEDIDDNYVYFNDTEYAYEQEVDIRPGTPIYLDAYRIAHEYEAVDEGEQRATEAIELYDMYKAGDIDFDTANNTMAERWGDKSSAMDTSFRVRWLYSDWIEVGQEKIARVNSLDPVDIDDGHDTDSIRFFISPEGEAYVTDSMWEGMDASHSFLATAITNMEQSLEEDVYDPEHNRLTGRDEDYMSLLNQGYAIGEFNEGHRYIVLSEYTEPLVYKAIELLDVINPVDLMVGDELDSDTLSVEGAKDWMLSKIGYSASEDKNNRAVDNAYFKEGDEVWWQYQTGTVVSVNVENVPPSGLSNGYEKITYDVEFIDEDDGESYVKKNMDDGTLYPLVNGEPDFEKMSRYVSWKKSKNADGETIYTSSDGRFEIERDNDLTTRGFYGKMMWILKSNTRNQLGNNVISIEERFLDARRKAEELMDKTAAPKGWGFSPELETELDMYGQPQLFETEESPLAMLPNVAENVPEGVDVYRGLQIKADSVPEAVWEVPVKWNGVGVYWTDEERIAMSAGYGSMYGYEDTLGRGGSRSFAVVLYGVAPDESVALNYNDIPDEGEILNDFMNGINGADEYFFDDESQDWVHLDELDQDAAEMGQYLDIREYFNQMGTYPETDDIPRQWLTEHLESMGFDEDIIDTAQWSFGDAEAELTMYDGSNVTVTGFDVYDENRQLVYSSDTPMETTAAQDTLFDVGEYDTFDQGGGKRKIYRGIQVNADDLPEAIDDIPYYWNLFFNGERTGIYWSDSIEVAKTIAKHPEGGIRKQETKGLNEYAVVLEGEVNEQDIVADWNKIPTRDKIKEDWKNEWHTYGSSYFVDPITGSILSGEEMEGIVYENVDLFGAYYMLMSNEFPDQFTSMEDHLTMSEAGENTTKLMEDDLEPFVDYSKYKQYMDQVFPKAGYQPASAYSSSNDFNMRSIPDRFYEEYYGMSYDDIRSYAQHTFGDQEAEITLEYNAEVNLTKVMIVGVENPGSIKRKQPFLGPEFNDVMKPNMGRSYEDGILWEQSFSKIVTAAGPGLFYTGFGKQPGIQPAPEGKPFSERNSPQEESLFDSSDYDTFSSDDMRTVYRGINIMREDLPDVIEDIPSVWNLFFDSEKTGQFWSEDPTIAARIATAPEGDLSDPRKMQYAEGDTNQLQEFPVIIEADVNYSDVEFDWSAIPDYRQMEEDWLDNREEWYHKNGDWYWQDGWQNISDPDFGYTGVDMHSGKEYDYEMEGFEGLPDRYFIGQYGHTLEDIINSEQFEYGDSEKEITLAEGSSINVKRILIIAPYHDHQHQSDISVLWEQEFSKVVTAVERYAEGMEWPPPEDWGISSTPDPERLNRFVAFYGGEGMEIYFWSARSEIHHNDVFMLGYDEGLSPHLWGDYDPTTGTMELYSGTIPGEQVDEDDEEIVESIGYDLMELKQRYVPDLQMMFDSTNGAEFRFNGQTFEKTAESPNVEQKAQKIHSQGGVKLVSCVPDPDSGRTTWEFSVHSTSGNTYALYGDTDINKPNQWIDWSDVACACDWGKWNYDRAPEYKHLESFHCGHSLAAQLWLEENGEQEQKKKEEQAPQEPGRRTDYTAPAPGQPRPQMPAAPGASPTPGQPMQQQAPGAANAPTPMSRPNADPTQRNLYQQDNETEKPPRLDEPPRQDEEPIPDEEAAPPIEDEEPTEVEYEEEPLKPRASFKMAFRDEGFLIKPNNEVLYVDTSHIDVMVRNIGRKEGEDPHRIQDQGIKDGWMIGLIQDGNAYIHGIEDRPGLLEATRQHVIEQGYDINEVWLVDEEGNVLWQVPLDEGD